MNPLSVFIRCNICSAPSPAAAAGDPQAAQQVVNVLLLSCKHLACEPCLSKLRDSNGRTHCPFCKNPVRCIRIDGRDKLPSNIKALFGNPMDMFKQALDSLEFLTGHAEMYFRVLDKEIRQVREDGQGEVNAIRQKNMQLEAAISAGRQRNHELRSNIAAMEKALTEANRPQAYLPAGSVKSPEFFRKPPSMGKPRSNKKVKSAEYDFFKDLNTTTGSQSDMDVFEKAAAAFQTPRFK